MGAEFLDGVHENLISHRVRVEWEKPEGIGLGLESLFSDLTATTSLCVLGQVFAPAWASVSFSGKHLCAYSSQVTSSSRPRVWEAGPRARVL